MSNAWRSLLLRNLSRISSRTPCIRHPDLHVSVPKPQTLIHSSSPFLAPIHSLCFTNRRWFSSLPAPDGNDGDRALVAEIFAKPLTSDEIKAELESRNLYLDVNMVNSVLKSLEGTPKAAQRFFDWVSESEAVRLNSKSYNLMLEIVGTEGRVEEFWGLVEIMKRKGFGVSKGAFLKVSESFEKMGLAKDCERLKEMYFLNSHENVVGRMCPAICKILRSENESEESIRKKLDELDVSLSSSLVVAVLERIGQYPKKASTFFRWVEGNPSFAPDGRVYNAMARVLGREDCIDEFWGILRKLRNLGYELEKETYIKVSDRFHKWKMLAAAVDLFKFAMAGSDKPSVHDFVFLLKKIVVSDDLDLNLISTVVRTFINGGHSIKGSVFDTVLKSLKSVGKLGECDKVLKAMEEGGFAPDSYVHEKVVIGLCNAGRLEEALQYLDNVEQAGYKLDSKTWEILVQKHSLAGDLDKALSCFNKMLERKGSGDVGCAFEVLVNGFCQKNKAKEACKILEKMVTKKNVKPWHSTYKFLIERLIRQGGIKEAFTLLGLMKSHGFPPFIDPFIDYICKSGSVEDAMGFIQAMTVKEFPSRTVFLRLFEGLFKEGRHDVAHGLLHKCPGSIRNHADILDLFYAMKSDGVTAAAL
ncbi:Pentatricopeptide repeat-containing protein, mitochondrial [Ananas comosus]|uniref:Pentatricopeptide repeat-containing protein, mitochondrial n=1 Tax=Ananas comosus TaxID=4615 RepID=A0A199UXY9_ANACO|nr:Pentatricopeptide repeat-containing protein, mitochondrial [Ananas comosus]